MRRRTYLAAATGATVSAVAGCTGLGDSGSNADENEADIDDDPPQLEQPDDEGTIDDFSDLEAWTVVAGAVSSREEDALVGDRAIALEADDGDEQARMVRELPAPVDCTGVNFGLAIASEDAITPMIQLFDDDQNVIDFRATTADRSEVHRCNFGVAGAESSVDLSEITEIHIAYFSDEGTEETLLLDDLHVVPRPEDGRLMLQFDGGFESIVDEGLPILEEYGYPATAFVPTDLIRARESHDGNRLTEGHLEDLDAAGWTIGSYTANGQILTELDSADRADQITEAREWLEEEGYEDGARFFSYPTGRYDEESLELVEETYDVAFAGTYPVQGHVVNRARYPRVVDPDVEDAEALLERTADLGGITTICYYDLEDDSLERFEETMGLVDEYVSAGDLELILPPELESSYAFDGGDGSADDLDLEDEDEDGDGDGDEGTDQN